MTQPFSRDQESRTCCDNIADYCPRSWSGRKQMLQTTRSDDHEPGAAPDGWTSHRAPLVPGWGIWRHVGLRGAGFPAALVAMLRQPESAAAADAVIRREDELRQQPRKPGYVRDRTAPQRAQLASTLETDAVRVG